MKNLSLHIQHWFDDDKMEVEESFTNFNLSDVIQNERRW